MKICQRGRVVKGEICNWEFLFECLESPPAQKRWDTSGLLAVCQHTFMSVIQFLCSCKIIIRHTWTAVQSSHVVIHRCVLLLYGESIQTCETTPSQKCQNDSDLIRLIIIVILPFKIWFCFLGNWSNKSCKYSDCRMNEPRTLIILH